MSSFLDGLKLPAQRFALSVPTGQSRLAGGQAIPHLLGAAYWRGEATVATRRHVHAVHELDLMRLARPGETFLAFDGRFNGPRMDPGGVILGASTPTIHTLNADNRRLRIAGLPAGYVLSRGDYIGWEYGSSPVRYALHRFDGTVTASGAGLTPLVAVEPHIRPGVTTGTAVQLVRPVCRARMVSGDWGASRAGLTEGATFEWEETLR